MRNSLVWSRRVAALLVVGVLLCAGCGGGDGESGGPAAGGGEPDEAVANPDGVVRVANPRSLSSGFDPHKAAINHDNVFLGAVYDTLLIEDAGAELVGGLATEWGFTEDGAAFDLHLREDVTFHDGAVFDAEAVRANLERLKTVEGGVFNFAALGEIEVLDPLTVRLHLVGDAADLPRQLADRPGMIISPDALESPDLTTEPVGTGMYRLVEYREGDRAVYERFEDYWDPEAVAAARLEIIVMPDPATRLNALRSGQVDLASIESTQLADAESAGLETIQSNAMHRQIVQFNRTRSEFGDARVRQALNLAIDRQAIADAVFGGNAVASAQYYTEDYSFGHVPSLEETYPFDPDAARELLAEAGLEDGFSFELLIPTDPQRERIAEILQSQWAEIGVTADLRQVELTQMAATFYGQLEGDALLGEVTGVSDPATFALGFYTADQLTNPGGHTIPRVDEAYEAANVNQDEADRAHAVAELVTAMVEEAGMIMIVHPQQVFAHTSAIIGFEPQLNGSTSFRGVGTTAP